MPRRHLTAVLLVGAAVLLVIGVTALFALPTGVAVWVLLGVGAACLIGEAAAPGVGALAGGGALAIVAAGLVLLLGPVGSAVTAGIVLASGVLAGGASLAVGQMAVRGRAAPPTIGSAGSIVGAFGVVKEADGWTGQVLVEGARWRAVSSAPLQPGMRVEVVGLEGLTAQVRPAGVDLPRPPGS